MNHKLTRKEEIEARTECELALWTRVFVILDDLETRLIKIESKNK